MVGEEVEVEVGMVVDIEAVGLAAEDT